MIKDCTAIILAGGESKRMGQDKATMMFDGEPLLHRAIRQLNPLFEQILISVRKPIKGCILPQLCDDTEAKAPIVGVHRALQEVKTNWVFVLAVDMPFVSTDLIIGLASLRAKQQAIVPIVSAHLQPLCAYYAKSCAALMQAHIDAEQRSLRRLIGCLERSIVPQGVWEAFDPDALHFLDIDCLNDLEQAKKHLQKRWKP